MPLPKEYAEQLKQRRLQVVKVRKEIRELEKKCRDGIFSNDSSSKDVTMDVDNESSDRTSPTTSTIAIAIGKTCAGNSQVGSFARSHRTDLENG